MIWRVIAGAALVVAIVASATGAELVTFKGSDQELISAKLTRPQGKGSYPALVLSQGRLKNDAYYDRWAERLANWGYVALRLDGFGPPCDSGASSQPATRAYCVCDAKAYLAGLPFVDTSRIGLMGWSQKGASSLAVFCVTKMSGKEAPPFRAAVVFYPYCYKPLGNLDFPLLILVGDRDERAPSGLCQERQGSRQSIHEFSLKIYPGATHYFDVEGISTDGAGYRVRYDRAAAADSILQVKRFLGTRLK
jgi:dienelactone hydrolase